MKRALFFAVFALLIARSFAAFPQIAVKPLCLDQLQSPTNITNAGDGSGRLFICEQRGKVMIFKNGMLQPTPFLDIGAKLVPPPGGYDERGLLGMTFHPDYENPAAPGYRRFYLYYMGPSPEAVGTSIVSGIAVGDPCTITTTAAHRLQTGDRVQITGVTGGTFTPAIVATHPVTVLNPTQFTVPVNCSDTTGLSVSAARIRPSEPVDSRTFVSEFLVSAGDPNLADPASERILLSFDKPQSNHGGGQIEFGPETGPNGERYLYFGVGDGGSQRDDDAGHTGGRFSPRPDGNLGNSQDKTKLLGKIHRIDPLGTNGLGGQYGIPADNPLVGAGGGVREEIYAYGMRNPWRFSFDPATGRMFCGDVGQDAIEEIDLVVKGGNYGWHAKEGTRVEDATLLNALVNGGSVLVDPAPDATAILPGGEVLIDPIGEYAHPSFNGPPVLPKIGNSVTGGYVYRGSAFPALVGKYVFADWGLITPIPNGTMLGLEETSPNVWEFSKLDVVGGNPIPTHVAAFGVDEQGEIYIATKTNTNVVANDPDTGHPAGGLYKIVPPSTGSVTIEASRDNSIFEDQPGHSNGQGDLSAGLAIDSLAKRRALLRFDVAKAVPRGVSVDSVRLGLHAITAEGTQRFQVHSLLEDWGEGASNGAESAPAQAGDATWMNAFFDSTNPTPWTTPGGEFNATASASTVLSGEGPLEWSGAGLIADVKSWLGDPASNFGWLIRDETEATGATIRRFGSRENSTLTRRPQLVLGYTGPAVTRREHWLQQHYFIGQWVNDLGDGDGDGLVEQIEYALNLSPSVADTPSAQVAVSSAPSGADKVFTVTFRRDPRATDLTYQLQTSSDSVAWTTLVESVRGATPTGSGFVSETDIAGELPMKRVTAQSTVPSDAAPEFRLRVLRYAGANLVQAAILANNPVTLTQQPPALLSPATGTAVKNPIQVSFVLPRAAMADSVKLNFDDGASVRTLQLAGALETAGSYDFSFHPTNPTAAPEIESGPAIPDGTYTVSIAYQDTLGNPPAADAHTNVKIDTVAPIITPDGALELVINAGLLPNYFSQVVLSEPVVLQTQTPPRDSPVTVGTVTVTLTARDAAGNEGTRIFDVLVRPLAAVNTKLIASGEAAPDAGTMGIPGGPPDGATLTSLGVPCIDNAGNVSYLAQWTGSAGRSSGLFHNDNCLIGIGGDAAPVTGAKIKTLSDPVGSEGNVALLATLSGVPKANTAVVLSNADGGRVPLVIAQSGTPATADGAKFKSFKNVAVDGEYTAFLARLVPGTGTNPRTNATNDMGLWVKDGAGPLVLALREGQMIGNKTIKTIVSFATGAGSPGQGRGWLHESPAAGARLLALVIFKEAKSQAIVEVDTATVATPLVLSQTGVANADGGPSVTDATFASYGLPAGSTQSLAFLGSLSLNRTLGITSANARGVFALEGNRFAPVMRVGDDQLFNNARVTALKDPVLSSDGGIAYLATLKGPHRFTATSLWWKRPGQPREFVTMDRLDASDLPNGLFKSFTSLAIAANRGPIFTATLFPGGGITKATANGAWAMDFKGELRLLVQAGVTQIDLSGTAGMKTVKSFTMLKALPGSVGVTRSFNDAQQVVWLATFTDKTQAIVTTEIP